MYIPFTHSYTPRACLIIINIIIFIIPHSSSRMFYIYVYIMVIVHTISKPDYYYYTLLEITNTLKSYNLFLPNIFQSLKPHIIIYLFIHLIFEISLFRSIHLRNFEFLYFHQWNKLYS